MAGKPPIERKPPSRRRGSAAKSEVKPATTAHGSGADHPAPDHQTAPASSEQKQHPATPTLPMHQVGAETPKREIFITSPEDGMYLLRDLPQPLPKGELYQGHISPPDTDPTDFTKGPSFTLQQPEWLAPTTRNQYQLLVALPIRTVTRNGQQFFRKLLLSHAQLREWPTPQQAVAIALRMEILHMRGILQVGHEPPKADVATCIKWLDKQIADSAHLKVDGEPVLPDGTPPRAPITDPALDRAVRSADATIPDKTLKMPGAPRRPDYDVMLDPHAPMSARREAAQRITFKLSVGIDEGSFIVPQGNPLYGVQFKLKPREDGQPYRELSVETRWGGRPITAHISTSISGFVYFPDLAILAAGMYLNANGKVMGRSISPLRYGSSIEQGIEDMDRERKQEKQRRSSLPQPHYADLGTMAAPTFPHLPSVTANRSLA